jgi:hypothetical protein
VRFAAHGGVADGLGLDRREGVARLLVQRAEARTAGSAPVPGLPDSLRAWPTWDASLGRLPRSEPGG